MPEKPPSWRQYDAPGDEPGEKIQPEDPAPTSGSEPPPPTVGNAPFVPYGDPHASSMSSVAPLIAASAAAGRGVGMIVGVVGGIAGVAVAAGVGIFFLAGGDGLDLGSGGGRDMHSQEALDELIADLRESHGTSEVFDATFYPDRAYVDLHVDGGNGQRYESYSWDGNLADWGGQSTDSGKAFDLTELDASLFDGFCAEARKLVDSPDECYIIVDPDMGEGWYDVHVNNEYSEGGYIEYDLDGKEISRNTW